MIKSVQHIPMGVSAGKTSLGCDIGRAMMVPRGDLFPLLIVGLEPQNLPNHRVDRLKDCVWVEDMLDPRRPTGMSMVLRINGL